MLNLESDDPSTEFGYKGRYYSIGQAAKMLGKPTYWIRWQLETYPKHLGYIKRDGRNDRRFTEEQLKELFTIRSFVDTTIQERYSAWKTVTSLP